MSPLSNLKLIRSARHLSQVDLAQRAGISQGLVSLLERGARPSDPRHIEWIAAALNVDAACLVADTVIVRTTSGAIAHVSA